MPTSQGPNDVPPGGLRKQRAAELRELDERSADASGGGSEEPAELEDSGTGTVGQGEYVVKAGDGVPSISMDTGHFWETIWNDAANSDLKSVRKDPHVLLPGDRVTIPELRPKDESGVTEKRHRFVRKGTPDILRLRILDDDEPRGNEPYTLDVDGAVSTGTTDMDGKVACPIPPNARVATLKIGTDPDLDEYVFDLGGLDPITELSGVQGRLNSLGFYCGSVDGVWGSETEAAIREFQEKYELTASGQPDDPTREKLKNEYGC